MSDNRPATEPTLYFIGVTTGQSSIMKVFPAWAKHLGLRAAIKGIDFPLRAEPAAYRDAVAFIKDDPLSCGALVTTHKVDLFAACRELFDETDRFASLMREASCLSKRAGRFIAHAKDPITSGLAIDGFLGPDYFDRTAAEAFCIGAGGSAVAITWHLMRRDEARSPPSRVVVSDRDPARLREMEHIHREIGSGVEVEYVHAGDTADNDRVLARLKPGSFVINATGLGKDRPGSPLTGAALFPEGAVAWDLNYRGDLVFLEQARAQASMRNLRVVDGWTYFIHGWTQVIAEVFNIGIDPSGSEIDALSEIAAHAAKA
jgi:shikimate 5-dehydrogenase